MRSAFLQWSGFITSDELRTVLNGLLQVASLPSRNLQLLHEDVVTTRQGLRRRIRDMQVSDGGKFPCRHALAERPLFCWDTFNVNYLDAKECYVSVTSASQLLFWEEARCFDIPISRYPSCNFNLFETPSHFLLLTPPTKKTIKSNKFQVLRYKSLVFIILISIHL